MTISRTTCEIPPFGILDACEAMRRPGESLFLTARRVLLCEALGRTAGNQVLAGRILGVRPRVVNYLAADLQIRPRDAQRRRYLHIINGGAR